MATPPLLVMVAGPNGSGKSTLTQALQASAGVRLPALYINADELARAQGLDAAAAQRLATQQRAQAIARRRDLMYETVMSHPSKLAELQQARLAGYEIALHFVATQDPSINVRRVALRVSAGGHDVPEERTRERYGRTMALAPVAVGLSDVALVFDNSRRGAEGGLQLQAQRVGSRLEIMVDAPAGWVELLAGQVNGRADELTRLQDAALRRGLPLAHARLDAGLTQGPVEILGAHYAAQHELASGSLVLHDRALLGPQGPVERGGAWRIGYLDGVASIAPVAAPATPGESAPRARRKPPRSTM